MSRFLEIYAIDKLGNRRANVNSEEDIWLIIKIHTETKNINVGYTIRSEEQENLIS